jgi:hypothetical protein
MAIDTANLDQRGRMSTSTDEIKIDLDEIDAKAAEKPAKRAPKKDEPAPAALETPAPAASDTEKGIEKLKKQLADEKSAREAAEARAREAESGEVAAKTDVQATQLDLVKNAITTVTQASDVLEGKYAEAAAAGDWASAAKIQRELAGNAARLLQLENGKVALEKAPKPTARPALDQVEEFANRCTPKSADWVRAHPEFVRDNNKNRQMIAAHELAIGRGMKADTPEYFTDIEDTLRIAKRDPVPENGHDDESALTEAARPVSERSPPPAGAPVSRSGSGNGSRPNVVRLSADEREIAKLNGMTDEEYARQKVALQKEGRLN